jgi:hypothetical protein
LIRQEVDGKPIQSRLVSAILLGATQSVPQGKDVGGAFQHLPLCRKDIVRAQSQACKGPVINEPSSRVLNQSGEEHNIGLAFRDGGIDVLTVARPRDASRKECGAIPEVGN